MARQDEILKTFLDHDLISKKYKISQSDLPNTLREALASPQPIIRTVAMIIDGTDSKPPITDNSLRNMVLQYLNEAAL